MLTDETADPTSANDRREEGRVPQVWWPARNEARGCSERSYENAMPNGLPSPTRDPQRRKRREHRQETGPQVGPTSSANAESPSKGGVQRFRLRDRRRHNEPRATVEPSRSSASRRSAARCGRAAPAPSGCRRSRFRRSIRMFMSRSSIIQDGYGPGSRQRPHRPGRMSLASGTASPA